MEENKYSRWIGTERFTTRRPVSQGILKRGYDSGKKFVENWDSFPHRLSKILEMVTMKLTKRLCFSLYIFIDRLLKGK